MAVVLVDHQPGHARDQHDNACYRRDRQTTLYKIHLTQPAGTNYGRANDRAH
jgi:hypothetical protein